jgi:hypothetical protein
MGIVKYMLNTAAEETLHQTVISEGGGERSVWAVELKTERQRRLAAFLVRSNQIQLRIECLEESEV